MTVEDFPTANLIIIVG